DNRKGRSRHRHKHPHFRKRAFKSLHVAAFVHHAARTDFADLVDAVGELIAAILDMHHRSMARQVAAVDVSDAGHVEVPRYGIAKRSPALTPSDVSCPLLKK